jgi:trans-AT polyketide synthase/acyltransferase/oxidoreductase domain-containing protein
MGQAVMFPGQGSQVKGMGGDLFHGRDRDAIDMADRILGYSIEDLCIRDMDNRLGNTLYTQPALFVVNALSYREYLSARAATPEYLAGHSLGEINALHAADVFDFSTGLKIVKKRAELMSKVTNGAMAAVLGLDRGTVETVLRDSALEVDVANVNSPTQIVISGVAEHIGRAREHMLARGATSFMPLRVSGAFHSRYMRDAQNAFREYLDSLKFDYPRIPVLSNYLGAPYRISGIKDVLASQISNTVNWTAVVGYIRDHGVTDLVEVGPGKVLTKLANQMH